MQSIEERLITNRVYGLIWEEVNYDAHYNVFHNENPATRTRCKSEYNSKYTIIGVMHVGIGPR
jgi:hypothetical protein